MGFELLSSLKSAEHMKEQKILDEKKRFSIFK